MILLLLPLLLHALPAKVGKDGVLLVQHAIFLLLLQHLQLLPQHFPQLLRHSHLWLGP